MTREEIGNGEPEERRPVSPLLPPRREQRRRIAWALAIAGVYMAAEIVGGLLANSLALLADAGHMATDVAALGISLWAMRLAERPPTPELTYGYHRAEILAALLNGAILVAVTFYIFLEAYRRLLAPPEVVGGTMIAIASGGLAVNLLAVWLLKGERRESLNVRGAWLHVVSDALGSVGVIVGAVLILAFGWRWADPVAGALIGLLILYSSWSLLKESVSVLMAATPEGVDVESVREGFAAVEGVDAVHDLHVWTLTSGLTMLTAHVEIDASADRARLLEELQRLSRDRFDVDHTTIQLETEGEVRPPEP